MNDADARAVDRHIIMAGDSVDVDGVAESIARIGETHGPERMKAAIRSLVRTAATMGYSWGWREAMQETRDYLLICDGDESDAPPEEIPVQTSQNG